MDSTGNPITTAVHAQLNRMGGPSKPRVGHRVARRVAATGTVNASAVSRTWAVEEITDAVQRTFE